jgi:hypothetical protein
MFAQQSGAHAARRHGCRSASSADDSALLQHGQCAGAAASRECSAAATKTDRSKCGVASSQRSVGNDAVQQAVPRQILTPKRLIAKSRQSATNSHATASVPQRRVRGDLAGGFERLDCICNTGRGA